MSSDSINALKEVIREVVQEVIQENMHHLLEAVETKLNESISKINKNPFIPQGPNPFLDKITAVEEGIKPVLQTGPYTSDSSTPRVNAKLKPKTNKTPKKSPKTGKLFEVLGSTKPFSMSEM